ncbi:MAG: 5-methylcytosine-specific restriction endonuclease system specificity protein McrC [Ectothiorhodospiraceae bacterium]|nr:5-methylcytosine-specific restriction endonuclease system specificity protein McrC [Ectothiorhodospiraceae bacterium]
MDEASTNVVSKGPVGFVGRIPVRNLWLLMLYASNLVRYLKDNRHSVEESPDELPDLIAELLSAAVHRRLRRNLTLGYRQSRTILSRIRGRVDILGTERKLLLARGRLECVFDELVYDTPRNRYILAALLKLSGNVQSTQLGGRCRTLATIMRRMGVSSEKPSREHLSLNQYGRHDAEDRRLMELSALAFELALPTEEAGFRDLPSPLKEKEYVQKLYEKAVAGFYRNYLLHTQWNVMAGRTFGWNWTERSQGIEKILPIMKTDIEIINPSSQQHIIIDTKFTEIVEKGRFNEARLKSKHIYQIYAYIRSKELQGDPMSMNSTGILLYPSIGTTIDESVVIQGHRFRYATLDLAASPVSIRQQLITLFDTSTPPSP